LFYSVCVLHNGGSMKFVNCICRYIVLYHYIECYRVVILKFLTW